MEAEEETIINIRLNKDIWTKAKVLALEEGVEIKTLLENLLQAAIEGLEISKHFELKKKGDNLLNEFRELRKKGKMPFEIVSNKTAVEIVREGRGE